MGCRGVSVFSEWEIKVSYPYKSEIKVRFADTDANGHTYFGNYMVFADEVMSEYWVDLCWDIYDVDASPCLVFTVNANIDFMNECLGGDWLDVEVGFSRMGNSSLTGGFLMTNRRTGEAAAKGSFTYVFVDKATRKSCPIPEDFKATILARQPELD